MLDNIKILLEEPEKVRKLLLMLLENILIAIFATKLYIYFFGEYTIIDFLNLSQWIEFILSGRVLVCIFCYIISEIILFQLLSILIVGIIYMVININIDYPSRKDMKRLFKILSFMKLISFKNNILKKGKYTDEFIEFITELQKKEVKEEISISKDSFLYDIIQMFFASVLVYYSFINMPSHSAWFHWLIFIFGLFVVLVYIGGSKVLDAINKNSDEILLNLHAINYIEITEKIFLHDCGIFAAENANYVNLGYFRSFNYKDEEYIWEFYYERYNIQSHRVDFYNKLFEKANKKILLTSNKEITQTGKASLNPNVIFVVFTSEEDLRMQLKQLFEEK